MKEVVKKYLVTIILIVVILVLVGLLFLKKERLVITDNVKDLYKLIGNNDISLCNGLVNYTDSLANFHTLPNDTRICFAYSLLNEDVKETLKIDKVKKSSNCKIGENIIFATDGSEKSTCTITKVDVKQIAAKYESVYGKLLENYDSFKLDASTTCSYYDNSYYCGTAQEFKVIIGAEPKIYRVIDSINNNGEEVYIYDYFLKSVNNNCYKDFKTDEILEKCSKSYKDSKVDASFIKKYGTKYKHTFKKNDSGYYWVSSEPVK